MNISKTKLWMLAAIVAIALIATMAVTRIYSRNPHDIATQDADRAVRATEKAATSARQAADSTANTAESAKNSANDAAEAARDASSVKNK